MKFADVAARLPGSQSVGGQLIVNKDGRNILIGKQVQGMLIVEENEEAKAIVFEATGVMVGSDDDKDDANLKPIPKADEPVHHQVEAHDAVQTKDATKK